MSLIDINELPQPIYPNQKNDDTNAKPATTSIPAEAATPAPSETAPKAKSSSIDIAALAKRKETLIAVAAVVLLAVLAGLLGGGDEGSSSFANSNSSRSSSSVQATSNTDDSLAGTLEQALFAYSNPSSSNFDCMAGVIGDAGFDSDDLLNGRIDEWTMADAVSGCVPAGTLTVEASGLVTTMYGQSYAAECLTGVFQTFDSNTWYEWVGITLYMDINALDETMVSMAPSCFF